MKKLIYFLVIITLICTTIVPAVVFADVPIKMFINGKQLKVAVAPMIVSKRQFSSMKEVYEAVGYKYELNTDTNTVTISKGTYQLTLTVGSKIAYMNGKKLLLDAPPMLVKSRVLVTSKLYVDSIKAKVLWSSKTKTIKITASVPAPSKEPSVYISKYQPDNSGILIAGNNNQYKDIMADTFKAKKPNIHIVFTMDIKTADIGAATTINNLSFALDNLTYMPAGKATYTYDKKTSIVDVSYAISYTDKSILCMDNTTTISNKPEPLVITQANKDYLYDLMLKCLKNAETEILIEQLMLYDHMIIREVYEKVCVEYPEYIYVDSFSTGGMASSDRPNEQSLSYIKFKYYFEPETLITVKKDTSTKVDIIISSVIKPDMSDMEKAIALHDYVITNAQYDEEGLLAKNIPAESMFAYGVLVKGKGVCSSYAHAISLLYNKVGIQTIEVSGIATLSNGDRYFHRWNAAKIDGKWGYIDATWDDPVPDRPGRVRYDYFFLTAEQLKRNHDWSESCYSTLMN